MSISWRTRPLALPGGVPSAIDDAHGLARLLYAWERDRGASPERLSAIEAAGKRLAKAAKFAAMEPGSMGHRAAPGHAREGLRLLAAIGWSGEVAELVEVARRRVEEALGRG